MKKAYFIADLHLGAAYREDDRAVERRVVAFLDSIKDDAAEIFLLGDILDYWFEYRHVVPRGYVRFFGKLAELSDAGVRITWLIGNHDIWIFDYLPTELGIEVVDGVLERKVFGIPFCIQHGDAIGGTRKFRFLRALFRNRFCQKLYSGIHPRFTVGFAYGCSRRSRLRQFARGEYDVLPDSSLIESIRRWCAGQIAAGNPARYYVFGHLHRLYDEALPDGRRLVVVPAWSANGEYGVFDGHDFYVMQHKC